MALDHVVHWLLRQTDEKLMEMHRMLELTGDGLITDTGTTRGPEYYRAQHLIASEIGRRQKKLVDMIHNKELLPEDEE